MKNLMVIVFLLFPLSLLAEENTIQIVTMAPANMRTSLTSRNIDGFIAWEPFCADVVSKGEAQYYFKSSQIWSDHPCCVVTSILNDKEINESLVWVHLKAMDFMENTDNRDKVISYAMDFTGKDKETVELALRNIKFVRFPDEAGLRKYVDKLNEQGFFVDKLDYNKKEEFIKKFINKELFKKVKRKYIEGWVPKKVKRKIRMGYLTADMHQLAYYVAKEEGYFDQAFNEIRFMNFKNGPAVMSVYKAGLLDAAYLGSAPAILKSINEDISIKIIAGVNNNGSALVINKGLSKSGSLNNKVIATPGFGTVQDFIVRMYADDNNIKIELKK